MQRYLTASELVGYLLRASREEVAQVREKLGVSPAAPGPDPSGLAFGSVLPSAGTTFGALQAPDAHPSHPEPSAH